MKGFGFLIPRARAGHLELVEALDQHGPLVCPFRRVPDANVGLLDSDLSRPQHDEEPVFLSEWKLAPVSRN